MIDERLLGIPAAIALPGSLLTSSSKYLNNARLREWIALICLRRNGPDLPPFAELREMMDVLTQLRDHDRVEYLFREERKINPALDQWFEEGFLSSPTTVADYQQYGPGSLGGTLFAQFAGKYEVEINKTQWDNTHSQFEFFRRRQIQTHDFEHFLTGGSVDEIGELVPSWFRMTNIPRYIHDQELAAELLIINLLASLRYTVRTLLHYPQVWMDCVDAIQRGMHAGQASDALFMKRVEPYLALPLDEARAALGVRGVVERDTGRVSAIWLGEDALPEAANNLSQPAQAAQ